MRIGESQKKVSNIYESYYLKRGEDRNSLLNNPGVLFQAVASEISLITACRKVSVNPPTGKVLDVGCGNGGSILPFLKLGFIPSNLTGIDVIRERIWEASKRLPKVNFIQINASKMPFRKELFDIVTESTIFTQMTDDVLARQIADEMLRVVKKRGYIILVDWRYSKPWDKAYKGLPSKRIKKLFSVGTSVKIRIVCKGALIPPIGRFLSRRLPSMYFVVQAICPAMVGQVTVVLEKT
jgi:SAM-dependent methyltransferase